MRYWRDQSGMALLLVLVVVALLSVVVIELSFSTLVDLRATETFRDRTQASYLARGGIEAARMVLQQDNNNFDHPQEFWGRPLVNIPAGAGDVSIHCEDLTGRLNLNFIADSHGNPLPGYHRFVTLCEEVLQLDLEAAQELADSLVYWFNGDHGIKTPDDSYYARQYPPYSRGGEKMTQLAELMLVKGFTRQRFKRLQPFVRVVGKEPLNLNSAPLEVLFAWQFSAAAENIAIVFDHYDIAALVDYRRHHAYESLADLKLVEGIENRWSAAWLENSIGVKGTVFQVVSRGRMNRVVREAQAIIDKTEDEVLSFKME